MIATSSFSGLLSTKRAGALSARMLTKRRLIIHSWLAMTGSLICSADSKPYQPRSSSIGKAGLPQPTSVYARRVSTKGTSKLY